MKIALIGDIHANLPALEAVLEDARKRKVEAIWNIGDMLGYNAFPDQVVKRLRKERVVSIVGNYDLKVLKFKKKAKKWRKKKHPDKYRAFKWAWENLSKKSREYLHTLPKERRMMIAGKHILLTHGSPASNTEPLYSGMPDQRLRELAKLAEANIVICGHSHEPFARKVAGVWFVNAGSVGRSTDGDPRSSYAIMHLKAPHFFRIYHYRLDYDIERAVAAIHDNNLPPVFEQMLRQGRGLSMI